MAHAICRHCCGSDAKRTKSNLFGKHASLGDSSRAAVRAIHRRGTMMTDDRMERVWERTRELRPVVEAHCGEGDVLRHLPEPIAEAFLKANVYRLLVPEELGGEGVDP